MADNPHDPLPQWLRTTYVGITDFPATNGIKVSGLIGFYATIVFLGVAAVLGYDVDPVNLTIELSAVLAMVGVGNWAESIKRNNPFPVGGSIGTQQDIESARAAVGSTAIAAGVTAPKYQPVSAPHPDTDPEIVAILNAEAERKAARQAGTTFATPEGD